MLDRGYVFGLIGSGDSHDGHPGLAHIASGVGGVAAILADDLTREGVWTALKTRRVYATNGPRIVLRFAVGGHPMGSIMDPPSTTEQAFISVNGTAPIDRVDLVRSGRVAASFPGDGLLDLQLTFELEGLASGEYVTRVPSRKVAGRPGRVRCLFASQNLNRAILSGVCTDGIQANTLPFQLRS